MLLGESRQQHPPRKRLHEAGTQPCSAGRRSPFRGRARAHRHRCVPRRATASTGTSGNAAANCLLVHARRLQELGAHRAGTQRGDGDAGSGQLAAHAFGVGVHERLGCRVAGLPGERVKAGGGPDVEDRAAAARAPSAGSARVVRSMTASTLTRTCAISSATGDFSTAPMVPMPALFTRMSTVKPRSAISSKRLARASESATSQAITSTRTVLPSSAASSRSRSSRRATSVTPWPRAASSRAMSAPMPDDAPVTTAVVVGEGDGSGMDATV